jgi:hypothetical protein
MTYTASRAGVGEVMASLSASMGRVRRGVDKNLTYTEEERRRSGTE